MSAQSSDGDHPRQQPTSPLVAARVHCCVGRHLYTVQIDTDRNTAGILLGPVGGEGSEPCLSVARSPGGRVCAVFRLQHCPSGPFSDPWPARRYLAAAAEGKPGPAERVVIRAVVAASSEPN